MTNRVPMLATVAGIVCASLLVWLGAQSVSESTPAVLSATTPPTSPLVALGWAGLAAWAAAWVSRGWLRVAVLSLGLSLAALAGWVALGWPDEYEATLSELSAVPVSFERTGVAGWQLVTIALLIAAWSLGLAGWRAWPQMSSKYDAPGNVDGDPNELDLWKALSEGRDPTLGSGALD